MKINFCIPGESFSRRFFRCWNNLIIALEQTDIDWELMLYYNPEVHQARNRLLGGNTIPISINTKPWNVWQSATREASLIDRLSNDQWIIGD